MKAVKTKNKHTKLNKYTKKQLEKKVYICKMKNYSTHTGNTKPLQKSKAVEKCAVARQGIASKIGSGFADSISGGTVGNTLAYDVMIKELGETTNDTIDNVVYAFDQLRYLGGDSCKYENGLYFYYANHLSSTQLITDINGSISQAVLYNPWGTIISEYRADWKLDTIPRYLFSAKEKDEESGMYYFEARYYSDEDIVFRGRDPMFEKYPSISPYAFTKNNPLRYVDPTGMETIAIDGEPPVNGQYAPSNTKSNIAIKVPYAIPNTETKTESKTPPPPKQNETTPMLDHYKNEFKNAETWEKKVEYGLKSAGEFVGFDEKKAIDAAAPIAQGLVLLNPLVGVPNGVYTAIAGEDIYRNEASTANRIISGVGVVAGGVGKAASGVVSTVAKGIDKAINAWTVYQTTRAGYKKQNNNENKKK